MNCIIPSSLSSLGHSVPSPQSVPFFRIAWRKPVAKCEDLCLRKYFGLYSSSKWTVQVQVIFLLYSLEDADFEEMTSNRCKAVLKRSVGDGQEKQWAGLSEHQALQWHENFLRSLHRELSNNH
jgi:hypothetical protein